MLQDCRIKREMNERRDERARLLVLAKESYKSLGYRMNCMRRRKGFDATTNVQYIAMKREYDGLREQIYRK